MFLTFLIVFSGAASAFLINDNFLSGIDSAIYTNVSRFGNLTLYTSGGLHLNGTNSSSVTCNPDSFGTYVKTKNLIGVNDSGFYSQTFRINATGGANIRIASYVGNSTAGLALISEASDFYLSNGTARLCSADTKAFDSGLHTFFVNITRGAANTTYSAFWDGVAWCSFTQGSKPTIQGQIQDFTCSAAGNGVLHDFVYTNVQFSDLNYTTNCPAKPSTPVFAADNFDYYGAVDSCFWYPSPAKNIYTSGGKLCFDATTTAAQNFDFYLSGQGNFYGSDVFTEEFSFSLDNNTFFEHTLSYVILAGGKRSAYTLDFFPDLSGSVQYYLMLNGTPSLNSLCSGCFNIGSENTIKITTYSAEASGYTALNTTSNTFNAILPNTYSVQINGGPLYFNLPIIEAATDGATIPHTASFIVYGGAACIDNYKIYSGFIATPETQPNMTGIPYAQLGEKCDIDANCFTNYCDFLHACAKKGFGAGCVANYECMSNKCAAGACTKPTLWQTIDTAKTDAAGSDANSNNLIAFVISLALGIVVLGAAAYIGAGAFSALAGGGVFFIALFFFAIVGWLSPFILIGAIVVLILLFAFIVLIKS